MLKIDIPLPPEKRLRRKPGRDRAEWRGSNDGIMWTEWYPLYQISEDTLVPHYNYYQARIEVCGEWFTSPISYRDNLFKF